MIVSSSISKIARAGIVALLAGTAMGWMPVSAAAAARAAAGAVSRGTWGQAEEVPGTAALEGPGGSAGLTSVSCAAAGDCSAGGTYADSSGQVQVFVVGETRGVWGQAQEVPGSAALNQGGDAGLHSLSCASPGDCSAGGTYIDDSGNVQVFVVGETHGAWGKAQEVPGFAALNRGGFATLNSLSCASAGNCGAGGWYVDRFGHFLAWVASERHGVWGQAQEVPGPAAPHKHFGAATDSVSCAAPGDCTAGGSYTSRTTDNAVEAFVVTERRGVWAKAQEVPGIAALNKGGTGPSERPIAVTSSVSCASAGSCSAGGSYRNGTGHYEAFLVTKRHGVWGKAEKVPGTTALNVGQLAGLDSVSCAAAGNCSAGGTYRGSKGSSGFHGNQVFVINQKRGVWGKAKEVPGTAALNLGGPEGPYAEFGSLSCGSAGNCSAGGSYRDRSDDVQAFVVTETHGAWGKAEEVPGTAALNTGGNGTAPQAEINSVSCAAAGNCGAGGTYVDGSGHQQAFVVNETAAHRS
jgi:hypothetical protein